MIEKIRVNVTIDKLLLEKAKKKLKMFGGKLSTLFNAYLSEFVRSTEKDFGGRETFETRLKELEKRITFLEKFI